MSVAGLHRLHPQYVRPEASFILVSDNPTTEPPKTPEEIRWWQEAQAEVDAICTALKDFYADTR